MPKKDPVVLALPVVAMRGVVIFPKMTLHFDVGRKKSIAALKAALGDGRDVFLCAQRDLSEEEPRFTNLCPVGVVASITQIVRLPNSENIRVVVEGKYRAYIKEIIKERPYLFAVVEERTEKAVKASQLEYEQALVRRTKDVFEGYADETMHLAPDVAISIISENQSGALADYIAGNISLPPEEKQKLLNETDPLARLESLCVMLAEETEIAKLENDIDRKVQERIDKNQREYYLREQIKVISSELDEEDSPVADAEKYRERIAALGFSQQSEKKLLAECDRLVKSPQGSPEALVIRTYLDRVLGLPWNVRTKDNLNIASARRVLESDHYGLEDVKQRIIELLSVRRLAPDIKGQIICLAGPPGVGKTSIAKSLARAMGRKYVRISLGGVRDEAEIRGHRKTYIGSMPGRIITALEQAQSANPLILLDEIDKLGNDFRGDPASALLEVLDGEQNSAFCDHYIEIPFDLSGALFITTANDRYAIPAALADRMEIIELYSYTSEEKFNIAKRHLIPKQLKAHGMNSKMLKISDDAINALIDSYTREAGVRTLERYIAKLCRKAAVRFAEGCEGKITFKASELEELLGPKKYKDDELDTVDAVGCANGLAWTSVGGELLKIEVAVLEGTGKLELTGSLGDVMKESARAAVSFVRSRADKLNISETFYKDKDIHMHFPEGAVPKDGPSAGVTIATALVSALSGVAVRCDVAMTGEITLRGTVLPIGGLKEKTMAAYKAGKRRIIIPAGNVPDLKDVSDKIKQCTQFVPVSCVDEVLEAALCEGYKRECRKTAEVSPSDSTGYTSGSYVV